MSRSSPTWPFTLLCMHQHGHDQVHASSRKTTSEIESNPTMSVALFGLSQEGHYHVRVASSKKCHPGDQIESYQATWPCAQIQANTPALKVDPLFSS